MFGLSRMRDYSFREKTQTWLFDMCGWSNEQQRNRLDQLLTLYNDKLHYSSYSVHMFTFSVRFKSRSVESPSLPLLHLSLFSRTLLSDTMRQSQFYWSKASLESTLLRAMYLVTSESRFDHTNRILCLKVRAPVYRLPRLAKCEGYQSIGYLF